jgi:uncharacterized membrane protein YdjX (TVP38/TMEM64 family)
MRNIFSRLKQPGGAGKRDWLDFVLKGKVLPRLGLALVVAISVVIGILYYQGRLANIAELEYIEYYGYPGVFVVSMIWNSTVLVPIPSFPIYFALGAIFHPALVGLAGGSGAAVGELTAYMAGRSGRVILQPRRLKIYTRVENWLKKWGIIIIFGFNLVPFFPFDLVGIAAGATRFPLWKFYLACLAGRTLSYGFIAWAGSQGWVPPLPFLNPPQ